MSYQGDTFLTNNGNRIDCTDEDDINIIGVINNNIATVTFDSTFGGKSKATLTVINDSLTYSIKDKSPFVEANMSAPNEIIFNRVISN
ncbi:hypothetical protein [Siccibacter colletis]|uniref:hypothetical protein n=1 Tax=Siccibacter colletis TaxID=1505757 RepID=UPI003CE6A790